VDKNPNGTVRYGDFLSKFHTNAHPQTPLSPVRQSAKWSTGLPRYEIKFSYVFNLLRSGKIDDMSFHKAAKVL